MAYLNLDIARRFGFHRYMYFYLMRLLRVFGFRIFKVLRRPLSGPVAKPDHLRHMEFRILTQSELIEFACIPELELGRQFLEDAVPRGDICVGALDGGRLIAYSWRSFCSTPAEDGFWVRFDKPNRYGYKGLTLPQYRGRHIQTILGRETDELMISMGYTHAISYIETHNFASLNSTKHNPQQKRVGFAGYLRNRIMSFTFATAGARRYGFSFYDPSTEKS